MTGYRHTKKYLFVGRDDRPNTWMEIGHDQAEPPETMIVVVEQLTMADADELDRPYVRSTVERTTKERHLFHRRTLAFGYPDERPHLERFVYVHSSIEGAMEGYPLSNQLAGSIWEEIMREEARQ
jgi:hypothetical protein